MCQGPMAQRHQQAESYQPGKLRNQVQTTDVRLSYEMRTMLIDGSLRARTGSYLELAK